MLAELTSQLQTLIQSFYAMEGWINGELIYRMLQRVAIVFLVAFLFSKSRAFELLIKNSMRKRDWFALYVIFAAISILGSVLADLVTIETVSSDWVSARIVNIEHAIFADSSQTVALQANIQIESRSIGAVLAGFLGGPLLGLSVGISSGLFRYLMGGDAAIGGGIGTTLTGLIAGIVHLIVLKTRPEKRFNWKLAFVTTCLGEIVMKVAIIFSVIVNHEPLAKGIALIQITTIPNTIGNAIGAALVVTILSDYERIGTTFSVNALSMAERFARIFKRKLPLEQTAAFVARTLQRETGAAAVAMTHQGRLLAFTGIGDDHHHAGEEIASGLIRKAITTKTILYLNGYDDHYRCKARKNCPLHSALIIPVIVKGEAEGTILLFEPKHRFFPKISPELGKSLARLLSEQILAGRYHDQLTHTEMQLTSTEWNLLKARVNPHFLSNALPSIGSVAHTDGVVAENLLKSLSRLMRERLDPKTECNTLQYELDLLKDYSMIEKTRFRDRLKFSIEIEPELQDVLIPGFILQILAENAIEHGTSQLIKPAVGHVQVRAYLKESNLVQITVEDNAGLYREENLERAQNNNRFGMQMVQDLIRTQFNSNQYGLSVDCEPGVYTKVILTLPRRFEADA